MHLFSTLQPHYTYLRLRHLKLRGVPVVVSTIYWAWEPEEQRMEALQRLGWPRYRLSRIVDAMRPHLPDRLRFRLQKTDLPFEIQARFYDLERRLSLDDMRRYIYDTADVLLPNSEIEYGYLQTHFGTRNDHVAVPNAVDPIFATGDADAFERKFGLRDFVLCCARVQGRKNQIRLIRAADALGLPLVLIGEEEPRYARRVPRGGVGPGAFPRRARGRRPAQRLCGRAHPRARQLLRNARAGQPRSRHLRKHHRGVRPWVAARIFRRPGLLLRVPWMWPRSKRPSRRPGKQRPIRRCAHACSATTPGRRPPRPRSTAIVARSKRREKRAPKG